MRIRPVNRAKKPDLLCQLLQAGQELDVGARLATFSSQPRTALDMQPEGAKTVCKAFVLPAVPAQLSSRSLEVPAEAAAAVVVPAEAAAAAEQHEVPKPPEPTEPMRRWVCHCGKAFPSSTRYHKHLRLHSDLRLYRCTEPGCGKSYKRKAHLDRHLRTHQEEKPFVCTFQGCTKSFPSQQKLNRHMLAHQRLRCEVCGKTFRKLAKLQCHQQEHAAEAAEEGRARKRKTQPALESREVNAWRRATRNKVYACDSCDEKFGRFQDLVAHRKAQHPKLSICPDCGKAYRRESALREHQRQVHEEALLICPHASCGQVFSRASNLHMHERVAHLGLRPFECGLCGQTFAYKHVLKRHRQRIHPSHAPS